MNKEAILNGMSEDEFYKLYPTEEHYMKAMGGQTDDGFYADPKLAQAARNSTPINFTNSPYYQEGGNINPDQYYYNTGGDSNGPLGYFAEGGNTPFGYGAFPVMQVGGPYTPNFPSETSQSQVPVNPYMLNQQQQATRKNSAEAGAK